MQKNEEKSSIKQKATHVSIMIYYHHLSIVSVMIQNKY